MVAQIAAVVIFLVMFALIITEKVERHFVTLGCGLLVLVVVFGICMRDMGAIYEALNLRSIIEPDFWYHTGAASGSSGINWETIFFLSLIHISEPTRH